MFQVNKIVVIFLLVDGQWLPHTFFRTEVTFILHPSHIGLPASDRILVTRISKNMQCFFVGKFCVNGLNSLLSVTISAKVCVFFSILCICTRFYY